MSDLIYVILVNYNQANYTLDCINSIINTGYSDIKILVIDNSTQQDNKDVLDLFIKSNPSDTISLIRNEGNLGYVGGINLGLNEAKRNNSEYILIMNNDTLLDKHAIINLLNTCKEYNNKAIISGKVYHYDDPQRLQQIGFKLVNTKQLTYKVLGLNEFDEGQYDAQMQMDLLDDVFWFFNINLYKEIGGYNTYFWFNSEQADFALRAKKAGYLLVYSPKAKIWHKGSASLGGRQNNPKLAY